MRAANVAVGRRTSKYAVTLPCGSAPDGDAEEDGLSDGDALLLTETEIDDDGDAVAEVEGEGETLGLALPDGETDGDTDGLSDADPLADGETLGDGETDSLGLPALGLTDDDGD